MAKRMYFLVGVDIAENEGADTHCTGCVVSTLEEQIQTNVVKSIQDAIQQSDECGILELNKEDVHIVVGSINKEDIEQGDLELQITELIDDVLDSEEFEFDVV